MLCKPFLQKRELSYFKHCKWLNAIHCYADFLHLAGMLTASTPGITLGNVAQKTISVLAECSKIKKGNSYSKCMKVKGKQKKKKNKIWGQEMKTLELKAVQLVLEHYEPQNGSYVHKRFWGGPRNFGIEYTPPIFESCILMQSNSKLMQWIGKSTT